MKRLLLTTLLFSLLFVGVQAQTQDTFKELKLSELQQLVSKGKGNKIINFWATWCIPCVKELPGLARTVKEFPGIEMDFVLLDSPDHIARAKNILNRLNNSKAKHYFFDTDENADFNAWISSINPEWTGSIPFTLLLSKDAVLPLEKEMDKQEFKKYIISFFNHQ